jgi:hypothetical protein
MFPQSKSSAALLLRLITDHAGWGRYLRGADPQRVRLEAGTWQLPDASTDPRKGDSRERWVEVGEEEHVRYRIHRRALTHRTARPILEMSGMR